MFVRTVCRDRDKAHVTVLVSSRCVVRSDAQETGILALGEEEKGGREGGRGVRERGENDRWR